MSKRSKLLNGLTVGSVVLLTFALLFAACSSSTDDEPGTDGSGLLAAVQSSTAATPEAPELIDQGLAQV